MNVWVIVSMGNPPEADLSYKFFGCGLRAKPEAALCEFVVPDSFFVFCNLWPFLCPFTYTAYKPSELLAQKNEKKHKKVKKCVKTVLGTPYGGYRTQKTGDRMEWIRFLSNPFHLYLFKGQP